MASLYLLFSIALFQCCDYGSSFAIFRSSLSPTGNVKNSIGHKHPPPTAILPSPVSKGLYLCNTSPRNLFRKYQGYSYRGSKTKITTLFSSKEEEEVNGNNIIDLTFQEKCQVVSYRFILVVVSIASGLSLIPDFFQGSGLSVDILSNIEQTSSSTVGWGILLCSLVIPQYRTISTSTNLLHDDNNTSIYVKLNSMLPLLSSLGVLVKTMAVVLLSNNANDYDLIQSGINQIFLTFICLREIGYYGAQYKVEAIIAITTITISFISGWLNTRSNIGLSDDDVITSSVLTLCLLVLSFGKIFEPLKDDIEPNGSSFFMD